MDMKIFVFRLRPGQDLKEELNKIIVSKNIKAGFILTCVGSLEKVKLRLAEENIEVFDEKFEIVSLVGTLSSDGIHIHISLADKNGKVIGGHLKAGCIVYTTAEIVIGAVEDTVFSREFDKITGFKELRVKN